MTNNKTNVFSSSAFSDTECRPHIYPMPVELLSVSEYALTFHGRQKYCFLRWVKPTDMRIDKITFYLYEYDVAGHELACQRVAICESDIPFSMPGRPFSTKSGIEVHKKCAEVRVQLLEVVSTTFIYTVRNGIIYTDHMSDESWTYTDPARPQSRPDRKFDGSKLERLERTKYAKKPKMIWFWALITLLAVIALSLIAHIGWPF